MILINNKYFSYDFKCLNPYKMSHFFKIIFIFCLCLACKLRSQSKTELQKLNHLSDSLVDNNLLLEAYVVFTQIVKFDPTNTKALSNKAIYELKIGDTANAKVSLDLWILHEPKSAKAYNLKGFLLYSVGSYNEAKKYLATAVDLQPSNATYLRDLASVKCALHLFNESMTDFDKALKLNPKGDSIYVAKAQSIL